MISGERRWGRFFVPADAFEVVADELLVVGMLGHSRFVVFQWPEAR